MNVASLELCRELHDLSNWEDTGLAYVSLTTGKQHVIATDFTTPGENWDFDWAYHLGYLLRKLPRTLSDRRGIEHQLIIANGNTAATNWCADYTAWGLGNPSSWYVREVLHIEPKNTDGDTPEDAAAKLAVELFKSGVLKHE